MAENTFLFIVLIAETGNVPYEACIAEICLSPDFKEVWKECGLYKYFYEPHKRQLVCGDLVEEFSNALIDMHIRKHDYCRAIEMGEIDPLWKRSPSVYETIFEKAQYRLAYMLNKFKLYPWAILKNNIMRED
jgi:hypothetical protein